MDLTVTDGNIGLRRVGLLRLHRMPDQKSIEFRLAAGKCFDDVRAMQFSMRRKPATISFSD